MVRVTIDGVAHEFDAERSILEAVRSIGIDLPAVCHDPRVVPSGACRVCVVRTAGDGRPVAACTTPIADGMVVETATAELEALRAELLRMLARACPGAANGLQRDTPFGRLLRRYDVEHAEPAPNGVPVDTSHPYISVDMNRCILCFRCVRICAEVQGQFTWRVWGRGARTRIAPDSGTTLAESSCVSCGACVDTCPTGALEDRAVLELGAPQQWTRTVCPYCGVGCELEVGTRARRIVSARPVLDAPVSKGHLCVKGRYAHGFVHAEDRITTPLIRHGDQWEAVSWDAAVARRRAKHRAPAAASRLGWGRDARIRAGDQRGQLRHAEVRPGGARHQQRRQLRARLPCSERSCPRDDARHRRRDELVRRHRASSHHRRLRLERHREPPDRRARVSSKPCWAARISS